MDSTLALIKQRGIAYRLLIIEAFLVLCTSWLAFIVAGSSFAYSALLGGAAYILPQTIFTQLSLRITPVQSPKGALLWFYLGEVIKILVTILIFAVSLLFIKSLNIGFMFIVYGCMLLINLCGLAILTKRQ